MALWHLLSLDAPTVAALWTWFIARTCHVHLPAAATIAMAIAVWMLYAADRLLDSGSTRQDKLEARHIFHHRHRSIFLIGIVLSSVALTLLLPRLDGQSIRLYLILGGLVFGYFVLIHAARSAHRLPKEIAVGIFFAAATFIPTVARRPGLRLELLAPALLFAMLCSLNCLFIYAWEHPLGHSALARDHPAHAVTRFALRYLRLIAMAVVVAGTALAVFDSFAPWQIPFATAIAAALLLVLHHRRGTILPTTLRAAADLVLTTPLLLILFHR
ncbi:hypothetical protein GCM10011507_27970 [Edaphobacter acidisoli]|uniref:Prenyltransferase n=1 Tax=Edaphobacter acidisoli TaxID=2040573 RepID=A0A916RZV3_9BACT|nr:hypothetical protein [Edaphobacter acidisoli]GGA74982.1 hypothetical protein GCM10011507_27970 [Edaphobacter acidisoli]